MRFWPSSRVIRGIVPSSKKEHSGREPVFEERGGVLGTLYSRK